MSIETRQAVCAKLHFTCDSQKADLLDPSQTNTLLVQALKNAQDAGFELLITSIRRDHRNDAWLGPHGHSGGFAADLWPVDEGRLQRLVQHFCTGNSVVRKVGLGGAAQGVSYDPGDTIVFNDNSTDHIHIEAY